MNGCDGGSKAVVELNDAVLEEVFSVMPDDMTVLFSHFNEDAGQRLMAMGDAIARGDAEALRRAAHSLKGGALGVGAPSYAAACKTMEEFAQRGDLAEASRQLTGLQQQLGEVMTALAGWYRARKTATLGPEQALRCGSGDE